MNASSCFLIIFTIVSLFLSAYAIRCHQCNSHLDQDCSSLQLNLPRPSLDEQYLRECELKPGTEATAAEFFCRKTILDFDVNDEKRIVRSCGYIKEDNFKDNTCYDADSEGVKERICNCFHDGCNAATSLVTSRPLFILAAISICIFWLNTRL